MNSEKKTKKNKKLSAMHFTFPDSNISKVLVSCCCHHSNNIRKKIVITVVVVVVTAVAVIEF